MIRYIKLETLEYPLTIYDIKNQNQNISYPDSQGFVPAGYAEVLYTTPPTYNTTTQKIVESQPENRDGNWYQTWTVVDLSDEEKQKMQSLFESQTRSQRNTLLLQSDWTQVADAPVDQNAWAEYRQQLRDITVQSGYPFEVVWPTAPQN